jgi:adenosylcobinamide-phosphate synthase
MDPNVLAARAIDAIESAAPQNSPAARVAFGNVVAFGLPMVTRTVTGWLLGAAGRINAPLGRELATTLFKSTLSIRSLLQSSSDAADRIRSRTGGGMETDTESDQVGEALRRISDDYTEAVVGPLFYFTLMGVPGAVAYRTTRVLREKWSDERGDHGKELGRAANRAFAAVNFIPSVLSGVFLSWSARWTERRGHEAWQAAREASRERSWQDSRWSHGAVAGALDVRLTNEAGSDILNPEGKPATIDELRRGRRLFMVATGVALAVTIILSGLTHLRRR